MTRPPYEVEGIFYDELREIGDRWVWQVGNDYGRVIAEGSTETRWEAIVAQRAYLRGYLEGINTGAQAGWKTALEEVMSR